MFSLDLMKRDRKLRYLFFQRLFHLLVALRYYFLSGAEKTLFMKLALYLLEIFIKIPGMRRTRFISWIFFC